MASVILDTGDCCFMGMPVMISPGVFPAVGNVLDPTVYGPLNELTGTLSVTLAANITAVTLSSTGLLTITGTNFGATQVDGYVRFNNQTATVATWSATSITAQLASSAPAGTYALIVQPATSTGYYAGGAQLAVATAVTVTPSGYTGAVGYYRQRVLGGGFC